MLCEIIGAVLIFLAILLSILPEYQKEESRSEHGWYPPSNVNPFLLLSRHVRVWVSVACVVPYLIGLYAGNVLENGKECKNQKRLLWANVLGWYHSSPQFAYLGYAFAFEVLAVFFYASMVNQNSKCFSSDVRRSLLTLGSWEDDEHFRCCSEQS